MRLSTVTQKGAVQMPGRDAGAEAGVPDRSGQRGNAAGKPLVGLQPIADGSLVAVVELHHFDGELFATRREPFQIAEQILLRDPVEEVVPAAPAGLEGTPGPRTRRSTELVGVVLEENARFVAQRHSDPLHVAKLPGRDGHLEANLHLHAHPVRVGLQVDEPRPDAAFQHPRQARGGR
jgi:hypothetical protein